MKQFINNLLNSLDNKKDNGFSGKKLTIISIMFCVIYGHYKLYNSDNWNQLFVSVLTIENTLAPHISPVESEKIDDTRKHILDYLDKYFINI